MSAPDADHDGLYQKWVDWLEPIKDDLVRMYANRAIWREILDSNENIPERFFIRNWIAKQYVSAQAVTVRRQSEADGGGLGALLDTISRNPRVLTRERYLALCGARDDENLVSVANQTFDRWSGAGGEHVDPDLVRARLERLKDKADAIKRYVDKRIAHRDLGDVDSFTYGDLNEALGALGEELQDLELLLRCVSLTRVEPYIQTAWQRAFAVPWLPPEEVEQ